MNKINFFLSVVMVSMMLLVNTLKGASISMMQPPAIPVDDQQFTSNVLPVSVQETTMIPTTSQELISSIIMEDPVNVTTSNVTSQDFAPSTEMKDSIEVITVNATLQEIDLSIKKENPIDATLTTTQPMQEHYARTTEFVEFVTPINMNNNDEIVSTNLFQIINNRDEQKEKTTMIATTSKELIPSLTMEDLVNVITTNITSQDIASSTKMGDPKEITTVNATLQEMIVSSIKKENPIDVTLTTSKPMQEDYAMTTKSTNYSYLKKNPTTYSTDIEFERLLF